jgi:prepilin-type N-terminal cleavage/methylation domain-containing protein
MKNTNKGFSLVELMVVVAIIGILASLAIPRFQVFQAKARQAEAKTNLSYIYTLEQSFYGDNDKFSKMDAVGLGKCTGSGQNALGFEVSNCKKARYVYTANIFANGQEFTATATSGEGNANKIRPKCKADVWSIDQDNVLKAKNDVTKKC